MTRNRFIQATVLCAAVLQCHAGDANHIHVGPVYTNAKGSGAPEFPEVQILVELPPRTNPQAAGPDYFSLRADGGAPIPSFSVQSLATTGQGIAVTVSLDMSGSMTGRPLRVIRAGLIKFVNDAGPQDKVAIQTIADDSRWDVAWTDDRKQVEVALKHLANRGSLTRLWDSLLEALSRFPDTPAARRLIVISDGHDEGSQHTEEEVIDSARRQRIQIDAIGITRSRHIFLETLRHLADETEGQFCEARNLNELEALVGQGIVRLHALPVVSFRADGVPADGKIHTFEVSWKNNSGESKGETQAATPPAVLPHHPNQDANKPPLREKSTKWWWVLGALVLGLIAFLIWRARRRREDLPPAVPTDVPVRPLMTAAPEPPTKEWGLPVSPLPPPQIDEPPPPPPARPSPQTRILAGFPRPEKGRPSVWLVRESDGDGLSFPIETEECWIGSVENNHLSIPDDPTISANHACIRFDHAFLRIFDHTSGSGTMVNGEIVSGIGRLLGLGDRIRIGNSTFVLKSQAAKEATQ